MAALRDLPQEIFDMVVAQVPPNIYVLVCTCNGTWNDDGYPAAAENLGLFARAEDANTLAREFVKIKIKEVECTEKTEYETTWLSKYHGIDGAHTQDTPDNYYDSWERVDTDGMITCGVTGKWSKQYYRLDVDKYPVHRGEWNIKNLILPEVPHSGHQDGCRCSEENDEGEPAATSHNFGADDVEEIDEDEERTEIERTDASTLKECCVDVAEH